MLGYRKKRRLTWVISQDHPSKILHLILEGLGIPQLYIKRLYLMLRNWDRNLSWSSIDFVRESWSLLLTSGDRSDELAEARIYLLETRLQVVICIGHYKHACFTFEFVVIRIGPFNIRKLIVTSDDKVLRNVSHLINVVDRVNNLHGFSERWRIDLSCNISSDIVMKSECKPIEWPPLEVNILDQIRDYWHLWSDCDNFCGTVFTLYSAW
jgi:hypothetical protein